jgi:hypothetical protein
VNTLRLARDLNGARQIPGESCRVFSSSADIFY